MNQTQVGQDVIFTLKEALVHEEVKGAFEISSLDVDFYSKTRLTMKDLVGAELTESTKALRKLMSKRTAKIIRMASLSALGPSIEIKLAQDERELYHSVYKSCVLFKDIVTKGEQNV
jgi:DNA replication initiation complex subunit (GINS family)